LFVCRRRVRAGPPLRDLIKKRFGSDSEDGGKLAACGKQKTEEKMEDGRNGDAGNMDFPEGRRPGNGRARRGEAK
jgi:hypothetical protein